MDGLAQAKKIIKKAKTIVIAGHVNPDGDSIGSLLGLGLAMRAMGKAVYMISFDGVPRRYRDLPGARRIVRSISKPVDLAIAVDCSSREILGRNFDSFKKAKTVLEIDHHGFRRPFGDACIVDAAASAVGEIIYDLLVALKAPISREVAQNLITSIVVETNSFRLPSVQPVTFDICSRLMNTGINFYKLVDMVYWSRRKESVALSGICLERCVYRKGGRLVWSIIRARDFKRTGGRDEDVDAVPDEMRSIKHVHIAILFREKDSGTLRVSLRSKNRINVARIAETYNGGGHYDVAGCTIRNSTHSINAFLEAVEKLLP